MLPLRSSLSARAFGAVVVASAAVLAGACSGGGKHSETPTTPAVTASASGTAARRSPVLTVGKVDVQTAGRAVSVSSRTQHAVLAVAQQYVDAAITEPLETGKVGSAYAGLFVAGLRAAVTGPDEHILTELPVGRTAVSSEVASPVAISALADQSGALLFLSTSFDMHVDATGPRGVIAVSRRIELTYEAVHRLWSVVAYRVTVTRHRPAPKPRRRSTTTAHAARGQGAS